jgi:hypothetical protein
MKFYISGTRTTTVTVDVTEEINGEIEITKSNVIKYTGCAAVEDGDSTAWYSHVSEALELGAPHKVVKGSAVEAGRSESARTGWLDAPHIDW